MKPRSQPIIDLRNVVVSFGKHTVHRDLTFSIQPGESVTVLGPSGIGKTLVLKLIAGLLRPTAGVVEVLGTDLSSLPEQSIQEIRSHIGMLFQGAALFDSLSVFENIAYSLRERGLMDEEQITQTVTEKLRLVGLSAIASKSPPQLSGGQKKRVGLARALASSPKIMLFDEPTTGLDPTAIRLIDDLIIKLNKEFGITCISVTHDIESAKRISNRWLLINNGTVIADGDVSSITSDSKEVHEFITGNWRGEVLAS